MAKDASRSEPPRQFPLLRALDGARGRAGQAMPVAGDDPVDALRDAPDDREPHHHAEERPASATLAEDRSHGSSAAHDASVGPDVMHGGGSGVLGDAVGRQIGALEGLEPHVTTF